MKIENEFWVDAPLDLVWETLTDIPLIAPCMPGAKLTDVDGETYSGTVKIKVGPVTALYSGDAYFVSKDADAHRAELSAKGRDSRGSGNAQAIIVAEMVAEGSGTKVSIDTDLKVSGKVAQFGRGVMVDVSTKLIDVSTKLIGQFVECLEGKLHPDTEDAQSEDAQSEGAGSSSRLAPSTEEPDLEPLDLMDVAGGALLKRAAPAVAIVLLLLLIRKAFR